MNYFPSQYQKMETVIILRFAFKCAKFKLFCLNFWPVQASEWLAGFCILLFFFFIKSGVGAECVFKYDISFSLRAVDDVWEPWLLNFTVKCLEQKKSIQMFYTHFIFFFLHSEFIYIGKMFSDHASFKEHKTVSVLTV